MIIGGLQIGSSSKAYTHSSRWTGLVHAPPKYGKTRLCGTLDDVTQKYMNKRTLFIACDAGEGGGTVSIAEKDIPIVVPATVDDMENIIADLEVDTEFGGVVLDSGGEIVKRILTPYITSETRTTETNSATLDARRQGVPTRTDYAKIGERARVWFNRLVSLSMTTKIVDGVKVPDDDRRKHVFITAHQRIKTDDSNKIVSIGPDLPGQLADNACGLVQTVLSLRKNPVRTKDKDGKPIRSYEYSIMSEPDNGLPYVVGDRFGVFENGAPLDFMYIYENIFMNRVKDK